MEKDLDDLTPVRDGLAHAKHRQYRLGHSVCPEVKSQFQLDLEAPGFGAGATSGTVPMDLGGVMCGNVQTTESIVSDDYFPATIGNEK
ncbi:MAG TPA: hypothetical protein VIM35_01165 [Gallionella sp.]